jgi:hypothetical protein
MSSGSRRDVVGGPARLPRHPIAGVFGAGGGAGSRRAPLAGETGRGLFRTRGRGAHVERGEVGRP